MASLFFGDALTHSLDDPAKLLPLDANFGKLRLFASKDTIKSAIKMLERETRTGDNRLDILEPFTKNCRTELWIDPSRVRASKGGTPCPLEPASQFL